MQTAPLVSIVTPSYNQAAYLEDTIRSVLEQDYPNTEYLVLDGGSTDGSAELIGRYASRLAYCAVRQDLGQVDAIREGFARARGEYLGWLNSDDVLYPGAISSVVEVLESDPEALLVYGDNVFIDEAGRVLGPAPAQPLDLPTMVRECRNGIPQPGSLFRRRALEVAPLNERGYYFFDYEFVIRLAVAGRVCHLPRELAGYRLHPASKTVADPLRKAADYVRLAEEFFDSPDFPEQLRPYTRSARSSAYLAAGEYSYAGRDLRRARRFLARGIILGRGRVPPRSLGIVARSLLPRRLLERLNRPAARRT